MSKHQDFGDESVSQIRPVDSAVIAADAERIPAALDASVLAGSSDVLVDEMLRRLHEHDYLGTLIVAEMLEIVVAGHGLAGVCKKEALVALKPLMTAPLTVVSADTQALSAEARDFLSSVVAANSAAPVAELLPSDAQRCLAALSALHELLRTGAVRGARVLATMERANTVPAPPSKP